MSHEPITRDIKRLSTLLLMNEYCIKDHLGNTRLTFADKNNNGQIDVTTDGSTNEILQVTERSPLMRSEVRQCFKRRNRESGRVAITPLV